MPPTDHAFALINGQVILPNRVLPDAAVICENGRIISIGANLALPPRTIDARGGFIAPGYVDIHVHGGNGADFMDGTTAAVCKALKAHGRHGTTTIFPTTTTGSPGQIDAMLRACADVQKNWEPSTGARIGGVHFYGPYFAESRAGCHRQNQCRSPDPKEYLPHLMSGLVRVATCAAELPGAEDFYRHASHHKCLVTCGHSDASWTEMARAFDAGMRHVDHFWCAMSSVPSIRTRLGAPFQGSMEQFVLMHREMSTEVIADGCHLAPELLEFAYVMKGADRLCLVTDANRAMDMPPGRYRFGPDADGEWFESDGRVGFQTGASLASSVVGMDFMVRHMNRATSAGIANVIRMATLTPAERVGMANEIGSVEAGKRADLLILDNDLNVRQVFQAPAF